MYEIPSCTPELSIAEIVSPPPATEKALLSFIDSPNSLVPAENCGISKTPSGPFQIIVFASKINFRFLLSVKMLTYAPVQKPLLIFYKVIF